MELHSDKCHLLLSTKEQTTLKIGNLHIKNSLLKKNIRYKPRLQAESVERVKWNSKIGATYDVIKKRILMNAFFKSQFNYCPLIWMRYNCYLNNKINRLHERCRVLCTTLKNRKRSFCLYSPSKYQISSN